MNHVVTILLVEDEFLNRSLVQAILSRAQDERLQTADVSEADTLGAARKSLAERSPDVILLDVQLPDGSGLDLARQLRIESTAADGPLIIALTAGALPEQQAAAIEAGCDAVILKPYTADQFESVLVTHLDERARGGQVDLPA